MANWRRRSIHTTVTHWITCVLSLMLWSWRELFSCWMVVSCCFVVGYGELSELYRYFLLMVSWCSIIVCLGYIRKVVSKHTTLLLWVMWDFNVLLSVPEICHATETKLSYGLITYLTCASRPLSRQKQKQIVWVSKFGKKWGDFAVSLRIR